MTAIWVCGCTDRENGEHIIEAHYSACAFCKSRRADCKEIVVPSGLGGVFSVKILEIQKGQCLVKTVNNPCGFDDMPPFLAPFRDIERRPR